MSSTNTRRHDQETGSEFVKIGVSTELDGQFLAQESRTADGSTVILELGALIPADQGPIEVEIKKASTGIIRQVYPTDRVRRILHEQDSYNSGSTANQRGVTRVDEPVYVLKREVRQFVAAGAPVKVTGGLILGGIFGSYNALTWFAAIALLDLIFGLLPRVHGEDTKRSSTIWSRALQCGGSYIMLAFAFSVQQFFDNAHVNKTEMMVAHLIPGFLVWSVIIAYVIRTYGSFMKLLYGDKAPTVAKKMVQFAPKKVQNYFSDRDLWG